MTLANKITTGRILMVPIIVIALLENHIKTVYSLLLVCMATDFLDGLVARHFKQGTKLGAFLDPMADKLLLTSIFMTLTYLHQVPMWTFVVVFSRDLLIVLGWAVIHILTGSSAIEPRILGKITTAVQMATALVCLIPASPDIVRLSLWLMLLFTIASSVDYVIVGEKKLGAWT